MRINNNLLSFLTFQINVPCLRIKFRYTSQRLSSICTLTNGCWYLVLKVLKLDTENKIVIFLKLKSDTKNKTKTKQKYLIMYMNALM